MKRLLRIVNVLAILLLAPLVVLLRAEPPGRYTVGTPTDPGGSGKFYMGREISLVMGHQGAGWLERPEREKEEQPKKLLQMLSIKPGMVVADIGAGSGYYSFRLAEKVGAKGKVLAVDIQKEMLDIIRQRMKKNKVENIEPILGTDADPKLPASSVDLVLLVDVYHEFAFPYEMTEALIKALKPGGHMVFVEFRREDEKVPILLAHKMTEKQVLAEMAPHPLQHVKTIESLPWQHVIIFEKKTKKTENKPARSASQRGPSLVGAVGR
jgi:ubiquinone/menaquinone biosynthesis C-methylase UbiE